MSFLNSKNTIYNQDDITTIKTMQNAKLKYHVQGVSNKMELLKCCNIINSNTNKTTTNNIMYLHRQIDMRPFLSFEEHPLVCLV